MTIWPLNIHAYIRYIDIIYYDERNWPAYILAPLRKSKA